MKYRSGHALLLFLFVLAGCTTRPEPASLVLTGGRVVTMEDADPEAGAVAIRGSRIAAVGSVDEIARYIGSGTRVIDLEGHLAIPGFIEGHGHFMGLGKARLRLDLRGAGSWDEIVEMVRTTADSSAPGVWIQGRGWHQEKWREIPEPNNDGIPLHHSLTEVSPDNPVILTHASGHSYFINKKAMELAGIDRGTPDPPGGEVVKDPDGEPTGLLLETAKEIVLGARAKTWTESERRRIVESAVKECLSKGVTSFQDAGSSLEEIDVFRKLAAENKLGVRLWVMIGDSSAIMAENLKSYRIIGFGDDHLTVRAIKSYIDGALGTHTAWLLEPYSDVPERSGLNTTDLDSLAGVARLAIENGFQLCIHAIGDRGNREVLNLYENIFREHAENEDLRWRIEHAQHLHPDDIDRFAELGVIAAMQGIHCTSDAPWVIERVGEQRAREGAYLWRELLDSGAVIINGTDTPVEDVNPIQGFYASVSRRLSDGSKFYPDQKLSRIEALKSYTLSSAYAAFEEDIKGSLSPGKLADVTILSKDILTIPEEEIPATEVICTIVGGEVMYQRGE